MQPRHQATLCSHSNAICHYSFKKRKGTTHTGTTTRCKTHRRNNSRMKRPQPQPPHSGGTFHRRLQPLYTEKHQVSCSGFLPNTKPQQHHAAITMRFAASRSKPAPIYARGNIKWRQWCSHSNANCNQRFKNRIELHTQTQPLVAKHMEQFAHETTAAAKRRTDEVPVIAGCSHFTRKNTSFRAPTSSPTKSRCNIMQPFQCDLPPQLQETQRNYAHRNNHSLQNRSNNSRMKRPQPQPPHSGGTFHRRLQPHYTEKHKVSCSNFLPPQHKADATSCSHSNAICHHSFKKA